MTGEDLRRLKDNEAVGAATERAAVVAWLRKRADDARVVFDCGAGGSPTAGYAWLITAAEQWANKIEAGEHREGGS